MPETQGETSGAKPGNAGAGEAKIQSEGVGMLARTAEAYIEKGKFIKGFEMLYDAQEKAASDNYDLRADEAVNLGYALVAAGHVFYNYFVDTDGRTYADDRIPAIPLEGQGIIKFRQAAEVFEYAVESDPSNPNAYGGLGEMQWELGDKEGLADTASRLAEWLAENPSEDSAIHRLVLAQLYQKLDDRELAFESYSKAIEHSVGLHPSRQKLIAKRLGQYISACGKIDAEELQSLTSACLRAIILDPKDLYYKMLLSRIQRVETTQKPAA